MSGDAGASRAAASFVLRDAVDADLDGVREMFREYQLWLGLDLCFQSFEEELARLPGKYARPHGRLFVAEVEGRLSGVIALRPLGEMGVCEMKRLFVRDHAKGRGIGRALAERAVEHARAIGYHAMRLDTLPARMPEANRLYDHLGFRDIPAYYANPVPEVRYLELVL